MHEYTVKRDVKVYREGTVKIGTGLFINVAVNSPVTAVAGNGFRQALQNAKVDKSRISTEH